MPTRSEIEQAIKIIDNPYDEIQAFDGGVDFSSDFFLACQTAISCMQAQIKEPCEYCNSNLIRAKVYEHEMDDGDVMPTLYCPNCGRELK